MGKKWVIGTLVFLGSSLIIVGGITAVFDPFFHYHKPLKGVYYNYGATDYYINNGMVRNLEYDTVITGTSMTSNFKMQEANELFGVKSIRVSFLGEGFKVINDTLETAVKYNPDLKMVIRGVDDAWFISEADWKARETYPEYLYDDNLWNDVYYLYNKSVYEDYILPSLINTVKKEKSHTLDQGGFGSKEETGKEQVLKTYERKEKEVKKIDPVETDDFFQILNKNLDTNVLSVVKDNPDIEFYLFLPPYSILWWDSLNQYGADVLKRRIDLQQFAIEKMLEYDNIKLFSFYNNFDLICDFNNYVDVTHYSAEVNSQILHWMKEEKYELTKENYQEYLDEIRGFYCNYDYDAIFE